MNDQALESDLTPGAGDSQSPASQAGDKPTSGSEPTVTELLQTVRNLEAQVRSLQSGKDRSVQRTNSRMDDFERRLADLDELTGAGIPKKVALRIMRQDQPFEETEPTVTEPTASQGRGGNPSQKLAATTDDILHLAGIDPRDPEVTELYRQGKTSPEEVLAYAIARKKRPAPQPNPAQVLPGGGGQSVPPEDLMAQYKAELAKIPRGNVMAITNLQVKYQKQGLQI